MWSNGDSMNTAGCARDGTRIYEDTVARWLSVIQPGALP